MKKQPIHNVSAKSGERDSTTDENILMITTEYSATRRRFKKT
ncbi:MAG: hypothetical protein ACOYXT_05800 [Bacteroidota bacterium]